MSHAKETMNSNKKVFFEDEEGIYYIDDYLDDSNFKNEDEFYNDSDSDDDSYFYQNKHAS